MKKNSSNISSSANQQFLGMLGRFQLLSIATKEGIWEYDFATSKAFYNKGMKELFGYTAAEMKDNHNWWRNNIHPTEKKDIITELDNLLRGKETIWWGEYHFLCKNGTYKKVLDRLFVVRDENAKPLRLIGTMQDLTELHHLQEQVQLLKEQHKKTMMQTVIKSEENERKNISEELNENINQVLATINFMIGADKEGISELEKNRLHDVRELLAYSIKGIRGIANRLSPFTFNALGLKLAVEDLLENLKKEYGIQYVLSGDNELLKNIDHDIQTLLFRIAQTQLNNIAKHAAPKKIMVIFTVHNGKITLNITDNGNGADIEQVSFGTGFSYIQERVEAYGGSFNIKSTGQHKGFEMMVVI